MEPFVYPNEWQRSLRRPSIGPRFMSPLLHRYYKQMTAKERALADWSFLYSSEGARWLLWRERKLRANEVRTRVRYFHVLLQNEKRERFGLGFSCVFS